MRKKVFSNIMPDMNRIRKNPDYFRPDTPGRGSRLIILFLIALFSLSLWGRLSWSDDPALDARLRPYIQNGGIVVAEGVRLLYSHRGGEPFCPASTLKLATALMALHELGETYRFRTEFYLREGKDLIIKGYGDPFLVSEEWEVIAGRLREMEVLPYELRDLLMDPSSFSPDLRIPGVGNSLNPYDAQNGALVANFNTACVRVGVGGEISSAEPRTPLTPLARRLAGGLPGGRHRINLCRKGGAALTYAGELARTFLEKAGTSFTGRTGQGLAGPDDRLIYTHYNTRPLKEVIGSMMLYSSNYIANQLLLTAGLEREGEPATLEKGMACLRDFITKELGISGPAFRLAEGSGISRQNRITPQALLTVLQAFYPHRRLLPREERTGALVKTGTLRGIYSMGGYLAADRPLCFVIILNQEKNSRDRILGLLHEEYQERSTR